ncbi:MAG: ion transporter, partial [Acidobacteria bacterium]
SLVSFSVETLPDLAPAIQSFLRYIEIACVAAFTVEYLLRIAVADRPLGFVLSFFGLVDLAAILPFYVTTGVDLRSLRAVRLLRLFRALKLVRYSAAIRRFHRAFIIAREELVLFASVTALLLYFAAVGIYYCERDAQPEAFRSVFDGLWWAVATLTTVGYGDVYPITAGGKVFTFVILMVGLGVVSVPAGLVASALARAREEEL